MLNAHRLVIETGESRVSNFKAHQRFIDGQYMDSDKAVHLNNETGQAFEQYFIANRLMSI